jgi:hypothetical protein
MSNAFDVLLAWQSKSGCYLRKASRQVIMPAALPGYGAGDVFQSTWRTPRRIALMNVFGAIV